MELRDCVTEHADWFAEGVADRLIEFIDHEVELLGKFGGACQGCVDVGADVVFAQQLAETVACEDGIHSVRYA